MTGDTAFGTTLMFLTAGILYYTMKYSTLRISTGCTLDSNTQHLHDETQILPINQHLKLHASQLGQKAQNPDHPLHNLTQQPITPRHKKQTTFDNDNNYTINIDSQPNETTQTTIKQNIKTIHTQITEQHLQSRPHNRLLGDTAPPIDKTEETLSKHTRRLLAQLRTNKSPFLIEYMHKISPDTHPTPNCPLCTNNIHNTAHLFTCTKIQTTLQVQDLWRDPVGVGDLLARWEEELERHREEV